VLSDNESGVYLPYKISFLESIFIKNPSQLDEEYKYEVCMLLAVIIYRYGMPKYGQSVYDWFISSINKLNYLDQSDMINLNIIETMTSIDNIFKDTIDESLDNMIILYSIFYVSIMLVIIGCYQPNSRMTKNVTYPQNLDVQVD
jgi:hypothetical protein